MKVLVYLAEHCNGKAAEAAKRLGELGLTTERILPHTGVLTGSIDPRALETLRAANDVQAVEVEGVVHTIP